jgi:heme exporter protein A
VSAGPPLRFRDVSLIRGGRLLFEGLDLLLEPGGAVVVTGPNGAGKTSLIRLASGLLRAAAGEVERAGAAALADENPALDARLTLDRALGFWARLDGVRANVGMEAMGLSHLAAVPVRMLSTGQRKRATLARVVASGASLWLLDEPLNGLDADGRERLAAAVSAHRARGGALLAASHQPLALSGAAEIAL